MRKIYQNHNTFIIIPFCLAIVALMLFLPATISAETEISTAVNLSSKCRYCFSHAAPLRDDNLNTTRVLNANSDFSIQWDDRIEPRSLYLAFAADTARYSVSQYNARGEMLSEQEGTLFLNNVVPVDPLSRSLTIRTFEQPLVLCSLYMYGEGSVPDYHEWESRPEKTDFLVIAAHPDDEVLFMGAVIPIYQMGRGLQGFSVICCAKNRNRFNEQLNAAYHSGQRCETVFAGFDDLPQPGSGTFLPHFTEKIACRLAQIIRQYKPEVIVTHDKDGEYGHWTHKMVFSATAKAVDYAMDPEFDPESAVKFGAWQVKKMYSHLYPENRIELDVLSSVSKSDPRSAFEIASESFQFHRSQLISGRHMVRNEGVYSLSDYGLVYSAVGADTPGRNDMFEHIE